jgi:hypothetical protein
MCVPSLERTFLFSRRKKEMRSSRLAVLLGIVVFGATILGLSAVQVWIVSLLADADMSWNVLGWFGFGNVVKPILPWYLHIWQLLCAGYLCLLTVRQICFCQWCNFYVTQSITGFIITVLSIVYTIAGLIMFFMGKVGFSTVVIGGLFIWSGTLVSSTDMLSGN